MICISFTCVLNLVTLIAETNLVLQYPAGINQQGLSSWDHLLSPGTKTTHQIHDKNSLHDT